MAVGTATSLSLMSYGISKEAFNVQRVVIKVPVMHVDGYTYTIMHYHIIVQLLENKYSFICPEMKMQYELYMLHKKCGLVTYD